MSKFLSYWMQKIRKKDRMKGKYLTDSLSKIMFACPTATNYNLSINGLVNFINNWMEQNSKKIEKLWSKNELHTVQLKNSDEIVSLEELLKRKKHEFSKDADPVFEFDELQLTAYVKAWYEQKETLSFDLLYPKGNLPLHGKSKQIPILFKYF